MKDEKTTQQTAPQEAMEYPGVATDIADGEKASTELEKQATKELNNNPRDTDMDNM